MDENLFNSVEGYSQSLCHTCLSQNRDLFPLGKFSDVYYTLFSNLGEMDFPSQKFVCWECAAVLKKVKLFQAKVLHANMLLTSQWIDSQAPLKSLSSLTFKASKQEYDVNINFEDGNDKTPAIVPAAVPVVDTSDEQTEIKSNNIKIKEEKFDVYNDDILDSTDFYDVIKSEDTLKVELKKQVTKYKKKKYNRTPGINKNNEYILLNKKARNKLQKKMCDFTYVDYNEVKSLMSKEEESEFYKYKYKCKTCVLSWSKVKPFWSHDQKCHDVSRKFVCDYCKCTLKTKSDLRIHIQRHREVLECRPCGHVALGRRKMALHFEECHRVSCKVCCSTFRTVRSFFQHYNELHNWYICDHCGKRCKTRRTIQKHISSAHQKSRCEICNVEFKTQRSLYYHKYHSHDTRGGEDAYCVECDRQFRNVTLYRKHLSTYVRHIKDKEAYRDKCKRECPDCGKVYANRNAMKNHYNYVHLKQSKYVCTICDRQFLNRTRYVGHMRVEHEGKKLEKNKICTFCGKGFTTNRILLHHTRTHTGERPHACALCPASFAQLHAMRAHQKHVHMRVKRPKRV